MLDPKPSNPKPSILSPQPHTPHPTPHTPNPKPHPPNPKPEPLNPTPETPKPQTPEPKMNQVTYNNYMAMRGAVILCEQPCINGELDYPLQEGFASDTDGFHP